MRVGRIVIGVFVLGAACVNAQMAWTNIAIAHRTDCTISDASVRWTLCGLFSTKQESASPGGPQALEGYTVVAHDRGTVGLAMATIGNIELAGSGDTVEARSLQGGGVITGDGATDRWVGLNLDAPKAINGAHGTIREVIEIRFTNGATVRTDGDGLKICTASNVCKPF